MTEPILDVLRRLRDDARTQSAPDALEAKLVSAFREHHPVRRTNRKWLWGSAAIAASLLATLAWRFPSITPLQSPPGLRPVATVPQLVTPRVVTPVARKTTKPKPRKQRPPSPAQVATAPRPQAREFIQLPYAPAFDPYEGGQVVRVSMPGASVRGLGLPISADRVQADVLLGDDGVARAIRLISNSGLNSRR
jgi:hypothetical protein